MAKIRHICDLSELYIYLKRNFLRIQKSQKKKRLVIFLIVLKL